MTALPTSVSSSTQAKSLSSVSTSMSPSTMKPPPMRQMLRMMARANDYLMLLLEAQQREIGIVVESDDPLALRMALYRERGKTAEFLELSFVLSPDNPKTD